MLKTLLNLANPWTILILLVLLAAAAVGGAKLGSDFTAAKHARTEALVAKVREQAQLGAADVISKIEIKQTTIRQKVETTLREVPVYRDCVNDPNVERLLDAARTNVSVPAGNSVVPRAGTGKP